MVFFGLRMDFIFIVLVDASFGKLYIYIYCKNFENWLCY